MPPVWRSASSSAALRQPRQAEAWSMEQVAVAALSAQIRYGPREKRRQRASRRTTGARHRWIDRVSKYSVDCNCSCLGARASRPPLNTMLARTAGETPAFPGDPPARGYARRIASGSSLSSVLLLFLLFFLCFLL